VSALLWGWGRRVYKSRASVACSPAVCFRDVVFPVSRGKQPE
jgi:hypothetical protein